MMSRKVRKDRRSHSPLPCGVGRVFEPFYRIEIARRNRRFDKGIGVRRATIPVVGVGNISVGGTGKTPFVMWLTELLSASGCRPGIAMRGYKANGDALSDEQAEYADRLPGVPVVAHPDRHYAVETLRNEHNVDIAVLDDGFQHRQLARDVDVVLLDATRPVFHDRCLPAGWLREPVSSLRRAGAIVWTHCEGAPQEMVGRLIERTRAIAPEAPVASAAHEWLSLDFDDGASVPIEHLRGARVALASGIGNPKAFANAVSRAGSIVNEHVLRPDHHAWSVNDLAALRDASRGADMLLTTGKDWVKLRQLAWQDQIGIPIARPRLTIRILSGQDELESRIAPIIRRCDAASLA
jgi:tetraacyldisaccharide 4'-kinase